MPTPSPEEQIVEIALLHQALDKLPLKERDVLLLRVLGGLSKSEIAAQLNINAESVATYVCNARRKLSAIYGSLAMGD